MDDAFAAPDSDGSKSRLALRRLAEERVRNGLTNSFETSEPLSADEARKAIHELRVHQIELEMQNEELLRTQAELVDARARYFDLYDLAPVGYCTLDERGMIQEANLTAANLLGVGRDALVGQSLTNFICKEDQDIYYLHRKRLFETGAPQSCESRMLGRGGSVFWARMMATLGLDDDGAPVHRLVITDISENRKSEEALRESERLYHAIGDSIEYGVWICDPSGRNVYASESFLKLVGLTQKQCSDSMWQDVLHPDDAQRTIEAWRECVRTGEDLDIEHRYQGVDGKMHHVLSRGVAVKNESGQISCWTGINLDISKLKNAESIINALNVELKARLEEMNTLLEILPVGVWTSNKDGSEMLGNPAAFRLMGLTPGGHASFTNPERFLPGVRVSLNGAVVGMEDPPMAQVGRTGEPLHNFEYELLFADGTKTTAYASAVPLFDGAGCVRKIVGAYADITDLKLIEDELRESKERLRLALQAVKMATWDWNTATGEMRWNEECFRMFGYEVGAVEPSYEAWTVRMHPDDRGPFETAFHTARNSESECGFEFRTCRPDGEIHWHWMLAEFECDQQEHGVRSFGVLLDTTEKKEAELRIQKLNEELQIHVATVDAVNKELDSYSHSVSHDLRTPLRFVNKIAYLLLNEPEAHLSGAATQQVNMILQATGEMGQLIENLLLFSQVSREPMKKVYIDLRKLFQKVVTELTDPRDPRRIEVAVQELSPCQGDRTLLREVVVNLLTNALKFTRKREVTVITVGCEEIDGQMAYFVQDNGAGFEMSAADSLFVPFHRLHKPAEFEGTGIGLALVKRIIERHGGHIWAKADVDMGATFYFTLGNEPVG